MNLDDLKTSITSMSEDELMALTRSIRMTRRGQAKTPAAIKARAKTKKASSKPDSKELAMAALASLSPEQRSALLASIQERKAL